VRIEAIDFSFRRRAATSSKPAVNGGLRIILIRTAENMPAFLKFYRFRPDFSQNFIKTTCNFMRGMLK
jgi:hypothetical protein